ncbi:MAG TPA: hypothetical protein VJ754_11015, partial [Anaerolineae bacterium]|nr:hypothetical protein [Anaerolineae bacterium]
GARAMVQRTLPDRPAPPARRHAPRRPLAVEQNMPLMVGLAIGIPLIVAILVTVVYLERRTAAQVEALLTDARQVMADASASATSDVKRERWRTALAKAAEALSLDAENRDALDVRAQAQTQLDLLDGTLRVSPALLYDFKTAGPYRLSLSDIHLFVMEQTDDRVDRLTLTSDGGAIEGTGPAPVLARGIRVGERALGDLIDMAWVEAGGARQQSGLIILERGGLIEYSLRFNSLDPVPFAETSVPAGARRIDTFDGNLYVLDVNARQVWRYLPSGDGGYSGLPDAYFAAPPEGIDNAIDLAIDGNVYLIEANGRLHKYFAREEVTFSLAGLPAPIAKPAALAVDPSRPPGESSVYVADLDGARVVQFAPDGRFVRQIRSIGSEFDVLEDIWIDETTGRLYAIGGGRVYSAALPGASTP